MLKALNSLANSANKLLKSLNVFSTPTNGKLKVLNSHVKQH